MALLKVRSFDYVDLYARFVVQFEWKCNITCAFASHRSQFFTTTWCYIATYIQADICFFFFNLILFFHSFLSFVIWTCYSAEYYGCRRMFDWCLSLRCFITSTTFFGRTSRCSYCTSRRHQYRLWSITAICFRIQYPRHADRRSQKPTRNTWRWCCQRYTHTHTRNDATPLTDI